LPYAYLLKEDEVFKQYIDVHIEEGEVVGFIAYVIFFDPMGERRKPKRSFPIFVTQAQVNEAVAWAEMEAGIWRLSHAT
jgi:hypothetical protein